MDDRMEIDGDMHGSQQKSTTDDIGPRNLPVQEYPAVPQKIANYPPIYHEDVHPAAYPSTNPNLVNWLPGFSPSSAADRNPVFNPISTSMAINTPEFNQLAATHGEQPMTDHGYGLYSSMNLHPWEYGRNYARLTTGTMAKGDYEPSAPLIDEEWPGSNTTYEGERWSQDESLESSSSRYATSSSRPESAAYQSYHARNIILSTSETDALSLKSCTPGPELSQMSNTSPSLESEIGHSEGCKDGRSRSAVDASLSSSTELKLRKSAHVPDLGLDKSRPGTHGAELSQVSNTSPILESKIGHPEGCKDGKSRSPIDASLSSSDDLEHRKSAHVPDLGLDKSRPETPPVQGSEGMNMDHESNLQNFDHSPVMESTNCRPARSTEDTEFLTSSSGAKLFQLMDIRSDRQDLSYVEKIILPRGQIFSFCKELDAESTRESREGELSITFEKLDRSCLHVVGFYGSKDLLLKCFRCCNTIAPDDQVYSKMQADSLFPGLYAVLAKDKKTLFVFYWHHGRALPNASRRDISCNFVRYLVDLCDSVFILLEGSQETIREGLQKGKLSGAVRKNRKRELRIERLQATEDMVEFLPGFSLSVNTRPSSGHLTNFRMCDGSRCGILSRTRVPLRRFSRRQEIRMRLQEVSAGTQLFDGKFVHLSSHELQGEDLSIFLQCSGCSVGKEYVRLLEEHERIKDDFLKKNERDKENRLKNSEGEVEKAVTKFISEYLTAVFTWEEALHADASVEVLQGMLLSAQEPMQGKKVPQNNQGNLFTKGIRVAGQVVGQLTGFGNVAEPQDSRIGSRSRFPTLDRLESEIFTGFGKLNRVHNRFIFWSNRIIIRPLQLQDTSPQAYTVEHAPNTNGTPGEKRSHSGPLCFNERLFLRPLRSKGVQMKPLERVFRAKDRKSDGPLLTDTRVVSCSPYGVETECELEVLKDEFALGGLQDWVAFEADEILPQLKKKASLLSYVGVVRGQLQDEFIYQVLQLQDTEFLEALLNGQSQDVADEIRARWGETCTSSVAADILMENVVHQCKAVYTRAREELFKKFQNWFKRYMRGVLEMWIQLEDSESRNFLEKGLEEKRRKYLQKMRQNRTLGNQSGIKLRSCYLIPNADRGTKSHLLVSKLLTDSWFRKSILVVTYEEEVLETETERLLVQEISPSKHDLEELERDPTHAFIPKLQMPPQQIMSLDPSTEKLLMLTFLKTGQYLAFILTTKEDVSHCHIFFIPTPGTQLPVRRFEHGYDQIAFDDQTRFLALYAEDQDLIQIYRFDGSYKHLDFCGAEVDLLALSAGSVTWMKFIPGRGELVFVDSAHKVYVFEMTARMVRASEIQLPGPFLKAEVTRQGPCLLVFNGPATQLGSHSRDTTATTPLKIEIYWMDHSMAYITTMSIPIPTCQWDALLNGQLETAVRSLGSQEHLLLIGGEGIISHCLKITSASEEYQLFSDGASKAEGSQHLGSGLALDYLYHVYEKFSTNPPLSKQQRALSFFLVLDSGDQCLKEECLKAFDSIFSKLQNEKGKNFHRLDKRCRVHELSEVHLILAHIAHSVSESEKRNLGIRTRSMGGWIRQLLCLVPIQIARAENNCLRPLADGLELSADVDYDNTISLASLLRFGFYDTVFASWRNKPVKIISSMGKQSSGKSYLLNHLSGSLLDVSGGRCTDGVWMTVRFDDSSADENACMYVLLDFEGVGTFERSEQEDMLLSVLNAAVSNITIYNKKDFNIDRETETVFERFQNGVSLVKADDKLFKGIFHIVVKDVGEEDLEDLDNELRVKIRKMLANSKDNFLTKMYGGRVIFVLMAPFNTANFYADVDQIYDTIGSPQLPALYTDGRSFSTDLKLLIAQLCAKDWAPMDSKRMELRVYLLRAHLSCAISMGHLDTKSHETKLVNFDTHEEITDSTLQLGGNLFTVHDTGLKLKPSDGGSIRSVLLSLKEMFQEVVQRDGKNDETWHTGFVGFLEGVVNRRKQRVMEWISSNSQTFQQHDDIQRVTLEAAALCAELIQQLSVCSCTCEECFLRCTKEKGHADGHLCLGNHLCTQFCSYCVREKDADSENSSVNKCSDAAGHQGSHDCRVKEHTCDRTCAHYGQAANCNKKCAGMVGHDGQHLCNSREHKCKEQCSLHSCTNPCITPFEISDHSRHACHEKFCPMSCNVKGCNRRCESKDHFHDDTPGVVHYCGLSHPCLEKCKAHGNCAVQQDLIRTTATFTSKYGSFEYEHVAEQSGVRKSCCKEIPPFQTEHEGPHSHSLKENIVHFCDIKCPACGYFCTEPIGHAGLHNTVHGNMRNTTFSSDSEKIETVDRTYAWGESGAAEMCNMHCKKQGRGHLHLVLCPSGQGGGGICYSRLHADGVRHEIQKTGPHFDVPKDEMTHAAYWKHMQFTDPCSQEDQKLFNLCGHECRSEEHEENSVAGTSTGKGEPKKSFCTLQLWHGPASEEEKNIFKGGYVTSDGHHMDCSHVLPSNVVFIIDRSGSMCHHDVTPQFVQFQETHNNRLGCVFEAVLRFIRTRLTMSLSQGADLASVVLFNHEDSALTVVELEAMDENIVNKLLVYSPDGGTNFSAGLKQAERILLKSKLDGDERHPVVIFLSDGENVGSDDEALDIIKSMRREHGKHLQIFTVKLGSECWTELSLIKGKNEKILERMADEGKSFTAADRLILAETFIGIAKSLKPLTRALVVNGSQQRRKSNKIDKLTTRLHFQQFLEAIVEDKK